MTTTVTQPSPETVQTPSTDCPRRIYVKPGKSGLTLAERIARGTPSGLPADQCWEWTGLRGSRGYARVAVKQAKRWQPRQVTRILLGLEDGDPRVARHACDNPPCVNPAHLLIGTAKQNTADSYERGRASFGSKHSRLGLTEADVEAIRADQRTLHEIAADFGLTDLTVGQIRRGERWKHVTSAVTRSPRKQPRRDELSPDARRYIGASTASVAHLAVEFDRSARTIYKIRAEYRAGAV